MNDDKSSIDIFRKLQLMAELEAGEQMSQRELACRLGVAVGLVNSYLKNFVAKGFVRVKNYPRNRYAYLLTPKGMAEKGRLAFQHIDYFAGLYTTTRRKFLELFHDVKARGCGDVVFCGVDEVAEIAFLSLREAGLTLVAVVDDANEHSSLFEHPILPIWEAVSLTDEHTRPIIITSLKRQDVLRSKLLCLGLSPESVH